MIFTSPVFVIFFIIVLLGTLVTQHNNDFKHLFLLLASYFFYGWWDWRFCFLLLFVTAVSYVTALYSQKRWIYFTGIAVPLFVLGLFKYFNFFLESFGATFTLKIILPVGISFYTFQALSYVIDINHNLSNKFSFYNFLRRY